MGLRQLTKRVLTSFSRSKSRRRAQKSWNPSKEPIQPIFHTQPPSPVDFHPVVQVPSVSQSTLEESQSAPYTVPPYGSQGIPTQPSCLAPRRPDSGEFTDDDVEEPSARADGQRSQTIDSTAAIYHGITPTRTEFATGPTLGVVDEELAVIPTWSLAPVESNMAPDRDTDSASWHTEMSDKAWVNDVNESPGCKKSKRKHSQNSNSRGSCRKTRIIKRPSLNVVIPKYNPWMPVHPRRRRRRVSSLWKDIESSPEATVGNGFGSDSSASDPSGCMATGTEMDRPCPVQRDGSAVSGRKFESGLNSLLLRSQPAIDQGACAAFRRATAGGSSCDDSTLSGPFLCPIIPPNSPSAHPLPSIDSCEQSMGGMSRSSGSVDDTVPLLGRKINEYAGITGTKADTITSDDLSNMLRPVDSSTLASEDLFITTGVVVTNQMRGMVEPVVAERLTESPEPMFYEADLTPIKEVEEFRYPGCEAEFCHQRSVYPSYDDIYHLGARYDTTNPPQYDSAMNEYGMLRGHATPMMYQSPPAQRPSGAAPKYEADNYSTLDSSDLDCNSTTCGRTAEPFPGRTFPAIRQRDTVEFAGQMVQELHEIVRALNLLSARVALLT